MRGERMTLPRDPGTGLMLMLVVEAIIWLLSVPRMVPTLEFAVPTFSAKSPRAPLVWITCKRHARGHRIGVSTNGMQRN